MGAVYSVSSPFTSLDGYGFFNSVVAVLSFNTISDISEWWCFFNLVVILMWLCEEASHVCLGCHLGQKWFFLKIVYILLLKLSLIYASISWANWAYLWWLNSLSDNLCTSNSLGSVFWAYFVPFLGSFSLFIYVPCNFVLVSLHLKNTLLSQSFKKLFMYLLIDREEEEKEKKKRETLTFCFTYLCIDWLIIVYALTGDRTCSLGVSGGYSNQLSSLARPFPSLYGLA